MAREPDGTAIDLAAKLRLFDTHWTPKVVAELNDYQVKLVKIQGEFVWHTHEDTDELFLCLQGEFEMHYRDRIESVSAGDLIVVPKGVEHKPASAGESQVLIIEPRGVVNTGDATSEQTAPNDQWI